MQRRIPLAAGAALAALVLAGCTTGDPVEPGESETILRAAIAGEPDQLDPHKTSSYFSFQVLENVFDTLVEPDENLEMQPALAESWDLSDDQLTWTFHLREGVTFHDGSDFTADDVVYSYNRIIDEQLANSWRFGAVTAVTAVDEHTVEITVSSPSPNLLSNIGGFKGMAIVQEENASSGAITTAPIGTGPFSLAEYASGDFIELAAFADYWDGAPAVDGVTFSFISEGSTALAALKAGEIHWTDSIPVQQLSGLENDSSVVVGTTASSDYWYLAMNQARAPYDDVRVRQAIAYAIDRDAIAQVAGAGTAQVNQLAIPEASGWYTPYSTYSLDLDKAQSLLSEAGAGSFTMDLMVSSDYPETVSAAQLIADQLQPLGITVEIRTLDFATWLDGQNTGDFDMLMMGWLGNLDPDDFYYAQHHSSGAFNAQKFANAEVDRLLEAGRVETDPDARKDFYAQAATIIADEVSYLYLYNPSVIQAYSPSLQDYVVRGDRAVRFRDVSIG